jgi:hypothetical protein
VTVAELIAQLQGMPADAEAFVYECETEDTYGGPKEIYGVRFSDTYGAVIID